MQAILLAAGLGTRLKEKTKAIPKCMIEVNGVKIIDNAIKNVVGLEIKKLVVVTGFMNEMLEAHIQSNWAEKFDVINFIHSPVYETTNNVYSFWLARDYFTEPFILMESDVFFDENILTPEKLRGNSKWFADAFTEKLDGCMLSANDSMMVEKIEIIRKEKPSTYNNKFKSIGILFLNEDWTKFNKLLDQYIEEGNTNTYHDIFFANNLSSIHFEIANIEGNKWFEIDDENDLNIACEIFSV